MAQQPESSVPTNETTDAATTTTTTASGSTSPKLSSSGQTSTNTTADEKQGDDTHASYPLKRDGYELLSIMGKGGFGIVYSARCISNNEAVAIKAIDLEKDDSDAATDGNEMDQTLDLLHKEVTKMKTLQSNHTLAHYASFVAKTQIWIVMPKMICSCQQLMKVCKKEFGLGIRDIKLLARIIKDATTGLSVIHEFMMHRDVKPGNILISKKGIIKLADFGVSVDLIESGILNASRNTMVGTLDYMANEVVNPVEKYTKKADIWAFGVTCFELFTNKNGRMFRMFITDGKFDDLWKQGVSKNDSNKEVKEIDSSFRKFVEKCLHKEEKNRPTAKELLKLKFLKNVSENRDNIINDIVNIYVKYEAKIMEKLKEKQKQKEIEKQKQLEAKENDAANIIENLQNVDSIIMNESKLSKIDESQESDAKTQKNSNVKIVVNSDDSNEKTSNNDAKNGTNSNENENGTETEANGANDANLAEMEREISESIDFEKI